jgi:hypothetical protein
MVMMVVAMMMMMMAGALTFLLGRTFRRAA